MADDKLSGSDKEIVDYVNSMDNYKNAAFELANLRKGLIADSVEIGSKIEKLLKVQSDIQILLEKPENVDAFAGSDALVTVVDKVLPVDESLDTLEKPQEPILEPVEVSGDSFASKGGKAIKQPRKAVKAVETPNPSLIEEDDGGFPDFDEDDYPVMNEVSEEDNNLSKTDNVDDIQF